MRAHRSRRRREWQTYAYNALAHTLVGFGGFVLLGGWRLFRGRDAIVQPAASDSGPMDSRHRLTLAGIAALIFGVTFLGMDVGMTALTIAAVLTLLRTVDERLAIQRMPWGVILMVTGVTVLISILEKTKGMELVTSGLASIASPASLASIAAFGAGLISVYSSTSGVVLPAFLPLVPGLAARVGGVEPLPVAWAVNTGASLVDLSSLSTVGALFLAAAPAGADTRALFNALLAWGLAMTVVGALLGWLLFS